MMIAKPQVAVLHWTRELPPNAGSDWNGAANRRSVEVVAAAKSVALVLNSCGFEARTLAAIPPYRQLLRGLAYPVPDLVMNLTGSLGERAAHESCLTALLDLLGLPHTGGSSSAHSLCLGKGRSKALLQGLGLPTAPFLVLEPNDPIPDSSRWLGPVILKPDAPSKQAGLDPWCVVDDPEQLAARVERMRRTRCQRVLIESFLNGREFLVGIAAAPDPVALNPIEVEFQPRAGRWPILNRRAKRKPGSTDDQSTPLRSPARVEPELSRQLKELAVAAFRACGCRDYALVDFRLDAEGSPMILEVDPCPSLDPASLWARALRSSGRGYRETLRRIASQAIERGLTD